MAPHLRELGKTQGVKLAIAIDIGTTFTACSYCFIEKDDAIPRIQEINNWPSQVKGEGDAKVPTALYYDGASAKLHGAETEDEECLLDAEEGGWKKAEWFKLRLRPDHLVLPAGFLQTPMPPGVDVDDAYKDFFIFVHKNIREFIKKYHDRTLEDFETATFILTTPNGWEGIHNHRIRLAALNAGLVLPEQVNCIRFLSEGEAALHYAINSGIMDLKAGTDVLVCDSGGGTTDIGIYNISNLSPPTVNEICGPKCFVAGGAFVNEAAKTFIADKLRGTKWDTPEHNTAALRHFEKFTKKKFKGHEASVLLKIEESTESVKQKDIVRGRLRISGENMRSFFDPLIKIVIDGLNESMMTIHPRGIDHIVLIGGFAESDYVHSKLSEWTRIQQIPLTKPDMAHAKAVPCGALHWHIRSAVRMRVAKFHYGAETDVAFRSGDEEMRGRQPFLNVLRERRVRYGWHPIVDKGQRIRYNEEIKSAFHREFGEGENTNVEIDVYAYRFGSPPTFFADNHGSLMEGFIHLGTVKADLARCFAATKFRTLATTGRRYKALHYEVCISFEEVELRARLRWKENNTYKYGPAVIAYDV